MIEEFYVLKISRHIYELEGLKNIPDSLVCEIRFDHAPTAEEIEDAILDKCGCDGVGEVVKRYRPMVPFA